MFLSAGGIQDIAFQFSDEGQKLFGFGLRNRAHVFVFHCVPLGTAPVEEQGVILFIGTQDQRQRLEGAVVLQVTLGTVAGGIKENRTQFQGRVVGDSELSIGGNAAIRVFEIALDNLQAVMDLPCAGPVRPQPSIVNPLL